MYGCKSLRLCYLTYSINQSIIPIKAAKRGNSYAALLRALNLIAFCGSWIRFFAALQISIAHSAFLLLVNCNICFLINPLISAKKRISLPPQSIDTNALLEQLFVSSFLTGDNNSYFSYFLFRILHNS